jgi:hypothetical protein
MSRIQTQTQGFRPLATMLLAALSFLFIASYLVVPCMNRDASQFQDVGSPNSCSEHHLFKPQADLSKLFASISPETPFRLPVAILSFVVPCLAALTLLPISHLKLKRGRRSRGANLPFAASDPPRLPQFGALRDA